MDTKFLAGWSEVDLTPNLKVRLNGQFVERISDFVETPVCATALAMELGGEQAVFCACDLEETQLNLVRLVRENIKKRSPTLDPRKVILSATHTHTSVQYTCVGIEGGNSLDVLQRYLPRDAKYESQVEKNPEGVISDDDALVWLADCIARACSQAWESRKPALCANEFGRAAVGMCRRVHYDDGTSQMWGDTHTPNFYALEGGSDTGMELLYFFDEAGRLTGVAANLACPAQCVQHRTFISSDYWGKARMELRRTLGDDVKLLSLCAPAGDQCPVDLIRWVQPLSDVHDPNIKRDNPPKRKADPSMFDIEGSVKAGHRVAREILECLEDAKKEMRVPDVFTHTVTDMPLPVRRVTMTERDNAEEKLTTYLQRHGDKVFTYEDTARMHVHAGVMARFEFQKTHQVFDAEVHVLRLGDIAFATNPFELFLDFANWVRVLSPAQQTFMVQMANGALGYLPTEKAEKGGHYSAYVSSGITGHEGGDILVRETLTEICRQFGE